MLGETISYEELVGGSALAFRVQAYKQSICPSAPHAMAGYLRKVAADFPTSAAAHLHKAADLYEKMADQTLSAPDRRRTQIAPYPSKESPWTQAQRDEQMRRMREALVLEKQALEELRLALRE